MRTEAAGSGADGAGLIHLLKMAQTQTADQAEKLLAMSVENRVAAEKMAIAQQIIDIYA